uniref:Chloramphenicol 3-O phosphotransferase n=1 Tax=uncultured bacterium AOCefta2 TaxID=654977 RepID=D6MLW3_9BACT|nr:chloramphenicol 3-O phosphotransferase [uncultured bacterium AOCefta2]
MPSNPTLMPYPDIILVNGSSSSGKSTLCRALQARILHPYLCIGFDDFVFLSAPRYYRGADTSRQALADDFTAQGVQMISDTQPGTPPCVTAQFGPVFRHIIDSMAPAVRALVDGGNSIIFDHVLHDRGMVESCRRVFEGLDVFTVGVTCPIEILEARERSRGDRVIGRARGLVNVVHSFCDYDVWVDTASDDVDSCVNKVIAAMASTNSRKWSSP